MCRIAGIFNPASKSLGVTLQQMRDAMRHGGPDDAGAWQHQTLPLALGHRRLSIIDLSEAGHQPMIDEELVIVFNGEIYNFQEIRSTLEHYGYVFKTRTDTEVILKAFRHWGCDAFEYFNGMFALAIWDERDQVLTMARDHAGIKPLYYYLDADCLYFASEIRAFNCSGREFEENPEWRTAFLTFGHLPEPVTTLKNVVPLQKGSYIQVELPTLRVKKESFFKWKLGGEIRNEEEAIQLFRETFQEAVQRHMFADAPIGLFLSGGIDSSLLTLIAAKSTAAQLHTLSIVFKERDFSEDRFQQLIIEKTGAHHQSFLVTKSVFNNHLADATAAMDQPTIDGINTYFISLYAKEYGLKAVLSGLGADELFGGYPSFARQKQMNYVQKLPGAVLKSMQYLPNHRLRKLSYARMEHSAAEYLSYRGLFTTSAAAEMLDATEAEVIDQLQHISSHYALNGLTDGNRISWIETNFYMQNQLLKDSDFMSMWHGLEIRVPFLDKELMMMAGSINSLIKYKTDYPKYVLVKSFLDELPVEIWKRKKQGFTFPFERWLKENEYIKPANPQEEKLYRAFRNRRLSWGRYWCALLMNRFSAQHIHA